MKSKPQPAASARKPKADKAMQGEGNRDAARRFNEAEQKFVKNADVEEAARAAQPHDPEEARELERAEAETREHAKDEDPQLRHPKSRGSRKDGEPGKTPPLDRQDETAAPASPDGEKDERYAG